MGHCPGDVQRRRRIAERLRSSHEGSRNSNPRTPFGEAGQPLPARSHVSVIRLIGLIFPQGVASLGVTHGGPFAALCQTDASPIRGQDPFHGAQREILF
jgi:hypothetical protein